MSRNRILAVLAVVASLALASVALAAKVTGGTSTVTLSSAATQLLSTNHLTVAPVAPATASGSTLTFPITGGRLNKNLHGHIVHSGGVSISNGTDTITLRHLVLYSNKSGVSLFASIPSKAKKHTCVAHGKHGADCKVVAHYRVARVAKITGVTVSSTSATGTVDLTRVSAAAINKLAGQQVVKAGDPLGTITVTPTAS